MDCLNHGFTVDVDADARKVAASAYCVGFALKQCFAFHTVMDHMGYGSLNGTFRSIATQSFSVP